MILLTNKTMYMYSRDKGVRDMRFQDLKEQPDQPGSLRIGSS